MAMANSSSLMSVGLGCILFVVLVTMSNTGVEGAITCQGALAKVSPCLAFLRTGGKPPVGCCDGVRSIYGQAAGPADHQALCGCIKSIAPGIGAKPENINAIPSACRINIPYKYSPSLDCAKVH